MSPTDTCGARSALLGSGAASVLQPGLGAALQGLQMRRFDTPLAQ